MDKVTVNYYEDNEIDGPGGPTCEFKLNTNLDTLQRFMEEGKITKLNQNSTSCVASSASTSRYEPIKGL
jgi:hypothetical protein